MRIFLPTPILNTDKLSSQIDEDLSFLIFGTLPNRWAENTIVSSVLWNERIFSSESVIHFPATGFRFCLKVPIQALLRA